MTINARIIAALKPLDCPVVPGMYAGEETRYITFNFDLIPTAFADNRPVFWRALIQIHLFAPLGVNLVSQRGEIIAALSGAGFAWPDIVEAADQDAQHFVFETEFLTDERMETS